MNKTKLLKTILAIAVIVLLYRFIGCPVRCLTGIPCLGCGMTRAWLCALRFKFKEALFFHPLWLLPPVFAAAYLWLRPRHPRLYTAIVWTMAGAFAITYLIRITVPGSAVSINLQDGLLFRCIELIKSIIIS